MQHSGCFLVVAVDDLEVQKFSRVGEGVWAPGGRGEVNPNRKSPCCSPWRADNRPDSSPREGGWGWGEGAGICPVLLFGRGHLRVTGKL